MTKEEMSKLVRKYNPHMKVSDAVYLHDEDDYGNRYVISFDNIIVGSELVSVEFVEDVLRAYGLND